MNEITYNSKYKILLFLIVFTPWLEPYKYSGVDLDTLALLSTILFSWVTFGNKWNLNYKSKPFLLYGLIVPTTISIIYGLDSNIKSSFITLFLYTFFTAQISNNISSKYFIKYYRILVYIAILVFAIQELMYMSVGYRFSALIPFFDLKYDFTTMQVYITKQMFYPRSSSVFLEPSHFAQYILPYFAYTLSKNTNVISIKRWLEPAILLLVFFFLRSGCGVVCSIAIIVAYVLIVRINAFRKILIISSAIVLFPVIFNRIVATEAGEQLLTRTSELEAGGDYDRSGTQRIFRGFYVYSSEDFPLQLFGVGTGGTIDVINTSSAKVMFNSNERYLNNIHTLLIGFGLIGSMLFFLYLFTLFKCSEMDGRLILVGFLTLCFMESFFLNSKMILYFAFVYALLRKHRCSIIGNS